MAICTVSLVVQNLSGGTGIDVINTCCDIGVSSVIGVTIAGILWNFLVWIINNDSFSIKVAKVITFFN